MFVIAAATAEELRETLKRLKSMRKETRAGLRLFFGRLNGLDLLFVQTGVGPKKASAAARRILAELGPSAVLSIGAAGACDPALHVGDIVTVQHILHHGGQRFATDARLTDKIADVLQERGLPVSPGNCLTVAAFVHTVREKRLIFQDAGARVIDMESASLARRICPAGIPFADIRIISDTAHRDAFNIEAYYALKGRAGRAGACSYFVRKPGELLRAARLKRSVRTVSRLTADIVDALTGDAIALL